MFEQPQADAAGHHEEARSYDLIGHHELRPMAIVGSSLQRALTQVVRHTNGRQPRPSRIASTLGISRPVASRLLAAARATDGINAAVAAPGIQALRRVAEAALRLDAPIAVQLELDDAIEAFDSLIGSTPGGRSGLEALARRRSPNARHAAEARLRAAAFRANAELLGRRCAVQSVVHLVFRRGDQIGSVWADRLAGLRQDADAAVVRFDFHLSEEHTAGYGTPLTLAGTEPGSPAEFLIDADSEHEGSTISIEATHRRGAFILDVRPPANVSTDLSLAHLRYKPGPLAFESGRRGGCFCSIATPTEHLVMDVVFADDIRPPEPPRPYTHLVSHCGPVSCAEMEHRPERISLVERIEALGPGPEAFAHPGLRDHPRFIRSLCEAAGVNPKTTHGYRLRTDHPLLGSQNSLCFGPGTTTR